MNLPKGERGKRKNLANLSDEELAKLSPDELEEAARAKQNVVAIKRLDKEVQEMVSQEQWQEKIQSFAEEHGLSIEEAERLVRERMGLSKPSDFNAFMQFMELMRPKQSPIEEAFSKAFTARAEQITNAMFPMPGTSPPGVNASSGSPAKNPLVDAIQQAKQAGAQSLYLPDGSLVKLGEGGDERSALKKVEEHVTKFITDTLNSNLPSLFKTPSGGNTTPLIGGNISPELARLVYEDKWKSEERAAADARAQARDQTIQGIAAIVGAALTPEGYERVKSLLQAATKQAGKKEAETGGGGSAAPKMIQTTCWKCMRAFAYEEGKAAICPYCAVNQDVQCSQCQKVFTPPSGTNEQDIVCPDCHAELQYGTPQTKSPEPAAGAGIEI